MTATAVLRSTPFSSYPALATKQQVGRHMIQFGEWVCHPFFWSTEKLALQLIHPKEDRLFPLFQRAMLTLLFATLGFSTLACWLLGNALKMCGAALLGGPFLHELGNAKEQWQNEISLLSFNVCMYDSALPMLLGGVMPASFRMSELAKLIQTSNPDLVVLQELSYGHSQELMKRLQNQYPHFYTNIGPPTAWIQHRAVGPELFIASKAPSVSPPQFIPYKHGVHKMGFFCLETPTCWILNAHFPEKQQEEVLKQVALESEKLRAKTGKPCILAGDLNYRKRVPNALFYDAGKDQPTCSTVLAPRMFGKKDPDPPAELDDFILVDQPSFQQGKIHVKEMRLLEQPHPHNPWKALSDHTPLLAKFNT